MSTEREPAEKAAADAKRPLWRLSRDEQRVLIITFVGSLGSILVGAVVLGAAVAFARHEQKLNSLSSLAKSTGGSVLLMAFLGAMFFMSARFRREGAARVIWTGFSAIFLIFLVPVALLVLILMLTWVGIATGIH
jgi:hypothetical protein